MRLLLVEDDAMIGEAVLQVLRAEHYAVDWVRDGIMADEALRSEQYDLVLLDLGLPKRDGLDVLRALRARRISVPVLVATARDAVGRHYPNGLRLLNASTPHEGTRSGAGYYESLVREDLAALYAIRRKLGELEGPTPDR